ncbi:MAG: SLBB domain-containing protein [Deltaproteobacteria bacterium]|nr:SLBB domain-containing protein [Deltaproteobacteria bacterium]
MSGQRPVNQGQPQALPSSQSLGVSQPPQFPSQGPGSTFPGQFFYEPLSTIEAAFQQLTTIGGESSKDLLRYGYSAGQSAKELRQYGYSVFTTPVSTFAPVEDVPVGPDYILGPGDDLQISMWGAVEHALGQTVDRNGQILLPTVGPVRVWGLTFSQADQLIRQQLSRYYRGLQTNVTMGRLRTIRVYVVGEVCQPASYTISSLSTVTNALFAAGGPIKLGSLRNIQLKRNHHNVGTLDLYDFFLRGDKTRDYRLESGDTIFVPPIGSVAGIAGEVKRPAIYEISEKTGVADLIEMAGGKTPRSYLKRVQVIRAKPNAEREVIDVDLSTVQGNGDSPVNIEIRDGDMVTIYPTDPRIYNTLRLAGAVKHPGEYEFKPGMHLSQLVQPGTILPEAFLERVEIARLKNDLTTEILQVSLKQAWAGDKTQDVMLQPLDQITLRSEYRSPLSVAISGEVKRQGTYTIKQGERLSSVLKRAGGFTDKAYPKGAVFIRETVRQMEKEKLDEFMRSQQERLLAEASTLTVGVGTVSQEEAAARQAVLGQRLSLLQILASKVTLGRVVLRLDELEKLEGSENDLVLENGDSIQIPVKPASVMVLGNVRNPASVLHKENEDIQYYVNRAGGFSPAAAEKEMYVVKADGSAITGFLRLRTIDPGDVVVVPPSVETRTQWLSVWKEVVPMLSQAVLTVAGIAAIVALQ